MTKTVLFLPLKIKPFHSTKQQLVSAFCRLKAAPFQDASIHTQQTPLQFINSSLHLIKSPNP